MSVQESASVKVVHRADESRPVHLARVDLLHAKAFSELVVGRMVIVFETPVTVGFWYVAH